MSASNTIRRQIFFSGNVQGVGFRATTTGVARRFNVTGFVRNLPDGRVELVAEGTADEIDRFVAGVRNDMAGYIAGFESHDSPPTAEFAGFGIAR